MAGHPTVGTGFVLGSEGRKDSLTFELGVGPTRVTVERGDGMSGAATMEQRLPEFWDPRVEPADVARLVSLGAEAVHPSLPTMCGTAGVEYLYIPLRSRAEVAAARPDVSAMSRHFGDAFHKAVYAFAVEPDATSDVRGRMFFIVNGAPLEDPATGSAAGPLGGYLVQQRALSPGRIRLQQGYELGRPSDINIDVVGEPEALESVHVGGGVVKVAEGQLFL